MAYMSQEKKRALAPKIKSILKKYGMKGSIAVRNHSTLVVNIKSGKIDFGGTYVNINPYHYKNHYEGVALDFLSELLPAMNEGNHDNSDPMIDYFDVGWYVEVNIGSWNKPYVLEK